MVNLITTPYLFIISIFILLTKEYICVPYFSPSIVDDGEGYQYPSGYRPRFIPQLMPQMSNRNFMIARRPRLFRNRAGIWKFQTRQFGEFGPAKWEDPRDLGRPNIYVSMIDEPVVEIMPVCGDQALMNCTTTSSTPPSNVI